MPKKKQHSDVFISYSRTDAKIVERVEKKLKDGGLTIWRDVDKIEFGEDWRQSITRAIKNAACVVVFLSSAAGESRYVLEELAIAEQEKKRIFPLLVEDTDIPFGLNRLNYVDIRTHLRLIPGLIKSIHQYIEGTVIEVEPEDEVFAPPPVLPEYVDFVTTRLIMAALDGITDYCLPQCTRRLRASLLWVDEKSDELYIAAATNGYTERELRLRFEPGQGFAGEFWYGGSDEQVVHYPRSMSDQKMRENWNFDDEIITLTKQMGTIISWPLYDGDHLRGILSVDTEIELTPSQIQDIYLTDNGEKRNLYAYLGEIGSEIVNQVGNRIPLSFRKFLNLRSILRAARLIPPLPVKVRAAIFVISANNNHLYMLVGSEDFEATPYALLKFEEGDPVIGQAWLTGRVQVEDLSPIPKELRNRFLKIDNSDHEKLFLEATSILCAPIQASSDTPNSPTLGVFLLDSPELMEQAKLNQGLTLTYELLKIASRIIQPEQAD